MHSFLGVLRAAGSSQAGSGRFYIFSNEKKARFVCKNIPTKKLLTKIERKKLQCTPRNELRLREMMKRATLPKCVLTVQNIVIRVHSIDRIKTDMLKCKT